LVIEVGGHCLVALDIDGTLIPTLVDFEKLRAEIRRLLGVNHSLKPLAESLASLSVSEDLKEKAWKLIEEAEAEAALNLDSEDVSKSVECIKKMVHLSVSVIFVTARSARTATLILSKLGLSDFAESLISRDITPYRVEQLKYVLELSSGRRVFFVADTQHDKEAAEAVGIQFIKVGNYKELPDVLNRVINTCLTTSSP